MRGKNDVGTDQNPQRHIDVTSSPDEDYTLNMD